MKTLALPGAVLALCVPASAQQFIGFSYNTEVGAASRGTIGSGAGEVMTRIGGDECAAWGLGVPGARTIASIACVVQDANAATPETFAIRLYPEDPARPGFPDLAAGVSFATGIPGPTGTGGLAELRIATPAAPVSVPIRGRGDVFVAFALPAAAAGDGLAVQVVLGFDPGPSFARFDVPGAVQGGNPAPAAGPATSHFLSRVGTNVSYNARRQCWLDVEHLGAGGVGLVVTNQTSFPSSNDPPPAGFGPAPGTGDFLSGSAPDVIGSGSTRSDDITMLFQDARVGTGNLVVFLVDLDASPTWAAELPVAAIVPGATGGLCLVDPRIEMFRASVDGVAWHQFAIPDQVRAQLAGLVVKQQAAGFDGEGRLHASPCDAMRF